VASIELSDIELSLFKNNFQRSAIEVAECINSLTGFEARVKKCSDFNRSTALSIFGEKFGLSKTTDLNDLVDQRLITELTVKASSIPVTVLNCTDIFCKGLDVIEVDVPILKVKIFSIHNNYISLCYNNIEYGMRVVLPSWKIKNLLTSRTVLKDIVSTYKEMITKLAKKSSEHSDTQ
jgi:hypothetical protein